MNLRKLQTSVMDASLATAGGVAGRIITNKVAPMLPVIKNMKKFHPALAFLTGCVLMDSPKLHYVGVGMAATAGVDQAANFIPMLKYNPEVIMGHEDDELGKRLADELEKRLNEDVNSHQAALNEDVNSPGAALNGSELATDNMGGVEGTDERLEGVDGVESIEEALEGVRMED